MADIVTDAQRSPSWAPGVAVGIPGGIDAATVGWNVVDVTTYGVAEGNTASQNTTAFAAARAATPTANKVLYFPEGTYAVTALGVLNNQVIRGAGMFRTTLQPTHGVTLGGSAGFNLNGFARGKVIGGFTRGSQTLIVEWLNAIPFVANRILRLTLPNDPNIPVLAWNPTNRTGRKIYINVINPVNNGNGTWTLPLDVPIPGNFSFPAFHPDVPETELYVSADQSSLAYTMQGVEDIYIQGMGSIQQQLTISHGWKMWAKNVRASADTGKYNFFNGDSTCRFEMRGCFLLGGVTSAGTNTNIRIQSLNSSLIEDCIFYKGAYGIFIEGDPVNLAIGYNLMTQHVASSLTPSHQGHPMFNIVEGNVIQNGNVDGYHQTSSLMTMSRNWFMGVRPSAWDLVTGLPSAGVNTTAIAIKRWNYDYLLALNLFGTPGFTLPGAINYGQPKIGSGAWKGEVNARAGVWWEDWNVAAQRPYFWTGTILSVTLTSPLRYAVLVQVTGGDDFARLVQRSLTSSTDPNVSNVSGTAMLAPALAMDGYIAYADINVETQQVLVRNINFQTAPSVDAACTIMPFATSFSELDLGVRPTTKRNRDKDGNLVSMTAGGPSSSVGTIATSDFEAGETAQVSYMYDTQPDFMAGFNWSPFDVDNIGVESLSIRRIPAGVRFLTWLETGTFDAAIPGTPVYSPVAGTYDAAQSVTITADDPIYYTTDGSTPDNTDTLYTAPVAINSTTTLKAVAYDGATYSLVRTGTYTLKAATPTLTPIAGIYESAQNVTAATTTSGATVHYETGATEGATATPTAASPTTPNPISVTGSVVIKAVAIKSGLANSDVRMGIYTINLPAEPAPDAPSGLTATAISSSQIDLAWTDNSDNEAGFKIYRGTVSGVLALIDTVAAGETTYSDTGLVAETTYIYAVTATNDTDDSAATSEVSATTDSSAQPAPTRPRLGKYPRKAKRL